MPNCVIDRKALGLDDHQGHDSEEIPVFDTRTRTAKRYGLSTDTLRRLTDEGFVEAHRLPGDRRGIYYRQADVETLFQVLPNAKNWVNA